MALKQLSSGKFGVIPIYPFAAMERIKFGTESSSVIGLGMLKKERMEEKL
jgi:hypothetical protein